MGLEKLLQLENKVWFIREVIEGTIIVSNRKKVDLCAELKIKGFTPLPKEAVLEASIAGAKDPGRNARKPPRKAVTKKAIAAPVAEPMETLANSATAKRFCCCKRNRSGRDQKKAPAKNIGKSSLIDEDDEEIPSLADRIARQNLDSEQDDAEIVELEDRLARHNIESSPDQSEGTT